MRRRLIGYGRLDNGRMPLDSENEWRAIVLFAGLLLWREISVRNPAHIGVLLVVLLAAGLLTVFMVLRVERHKNDELQSQAITSVSMRGGESLRDGRLTAVRESNAQGEARGDQQVRYV